MKGLLIWVIITIEDKKIYPIKLAQKTLIFSKEEALAKRGENGLFDITMRSFDEAEICKIVGIYLLEKLSKLFLKENIGLYRDHGLATVNSRSGQVLDRMKNDIISILKLEDLMKIYCLDDTLNLVRGKYIPFKQVSKKTL